MDETNITTEEMDFDAGWDDDDGGWASDETEAETETEAEGDETEEGGGEDQPEAGTEEKPEAGDAAPEAEEESFELKYMGDTLKVGKSEMIALAQKGKDYDRIRTERDGMTSELEALRADKGKLTEYEGFLTKLAASVNMAIPDMMEQTLAKLLVAEEARKGTSITEDFALQRIRFEKEREAFEQQKNGGKTEAKTEAKAEEKPEEKPAEDEAAKARINDEVNAFLKKYPGIDPKTIAPEVLEAWRGGTPLLYAYLEHENKQLKAEQEAMEQNNKNSRRSTGSAKSAGAAKPTDPMFAGWDD